MYVFVDREKEVKRERESYMSVYIVVGGNFAVDTPYCLIWLRGRI